MCHLSQCIGFTEQMDFCINVMFHLYLDVVGCLTNICSLSLNPCRCEICLRRRQSSVVTAMRRLSHQYLCTHIPRLSGVREHRLLPAAVLPDSSLLAPEACQPCSGAPPGRATGRGWRHSHRSAAIERLGLQPPAKSTGPTPALARLNRLHQRRRLRRQRVEWRRLRQTGGADSRSETSRPATGK